jgi:hypothetical protein
MTLTIKNPASDLATELSGQTLGGVTLASTENLFFRPSVPVPMATCLYLLNTGGLAPEPFAGTTAHGVFHPTVQALIYSTPGDDGYDEGETFANAVFAAIQQIGTTLNNYLTAMSDTSGPMYLGQDEDTQRNTWSMNFTLTYQT